MFYLVGPDNTMEARKAMILMETSGEAEFGLPIFLSVMAAWLGKNSGKRP